MELDVKNLKESELKEEHFGITWHLSAEQLLDNSVSNDDYQREDVVGIYLKPSSFLGW